MQLDTSPPTFLGAVVQNRVNANPELNLRNLGLDFNPRLLCVVQN